jgi:hypothetical protein
MKQTLRLFVALITLAAVAGCDSDCGNEVVSSISSPSHAISAVIFNRDCGATTGFSTQVSIVQAGEAPSGGGNTLILGGTVPLKLRWVSESELLITGLGSARVFKQEQLVTGVSVAYGK